MLIQSAFFSLWNSVSFLLITGPTMAPNRRVANRQVTTDATSAALTRVSKRVGHGTLAGVGLRTIAFEPAASAMWTVLASGLDAARGCAGIGARGVHRGSATRDRWPRPGSTTRRSRVAVAWRAAATGPTDEGRLRLDRSGSNTGVNANAPKRGDGVSASAYSAGASKDGEDIFVDASRSRRNSQPEAPLSSPVQVQKPTVSRRRLFLAAVAGGIVAETAGQLAESTLMSERERLQLDQKRQKIKAALVAAGFTDEDVLKETAERAPDTLQAEIKRAGVIATLAGVGSVSSRLITEWKRRRAVRDAADRCARLVQTEDAKLVDGPGADGPAASSAASSAVAAASACALESPELEAMRLRDTAACEVTGTCAPDWGYVEGVPTVDEEATSDEEGFELSPMSAPWLRRADWDDVAKTIVFSTCYGGLFQPHWFNVLNSYDWSTAIIPEQVDIQMRAMIEAVSRGQYLPGLDPYLMPKVVDAARSSAFSAAGAFANPSFTSFELSFLPGVEKFSELICPLGVNQLIAIPLLYWPSFFIFTGIVEGQSLTTVMTTLHQRLPGLMKANLMFWIPAQGFQFAAIPVDEQAVYVASAGVVWNGILATIMAPKAAAEKAAESLERAAAAGESEVVTPPLASVDADAAMIGIVTRDTTADVREEEVMEVNANDLNVTGVVSSR